MAKKFSVTRQRGFNTIALFTFFCLYAPLLILVILAFNAGLSSADWQGFSTRWFWSAMENPQVVDASILSLQLAFTAALISTAVAIPAAIAMTRTARYKGWMFQYALISLPLMVPEIVTAVALLIVVAAIKSWTGYIGLGYLIIAHTAFCIPFAYLPIRARLETMDINLEAAASDLYARPFEAFLHITLPQLLPGVLAGFMLAFVISLDDVVITEFVKSPGQDTLPTYMLGQLRRTVTPEINAISAIFLLLSIIVVTVFFILQSSGRRQQ